MIKHYIALLKTFDLDESCYQELLVAGESIINQESFQLLLAKYYRLRFSAQLVQEDLENLSKEYNIHFYTLSFILLASASKYLLEDYNRANLSEELFYSTIIDLKYKLIECKKVHNVWGNCVMSWYNIFFNMNIFKLGRLEFERATLRVDYSIDGYNFKKGDTAYSIHIPSSGPLTKQSIQKSLEMAFEFFKEETKNGLLICFCDSWLLDKNMRKILNSKSNIIEFMNHFDLVEHYESDNFGDAWRIFNKDYEVNNVPRETSLQRAFDDYLKEDNKTGIGYGILVFDGTKIININ